MYIRISNDFLVYIFFIKEFRLKDLTAYIINISSVKNVPTGKFSKKDGLKLLNTFEPVNSVFRNRQITLVKDLYEQNKITSVKKAMALIKLVKENKMEEFANKLDEAENWLWLYFLLTAIR